MDQTLNESKDKYVYAGKLAEVARLEAQGTALSRILEKEFEILGLKSGLKVLDAGCGTGVVTRRIASRVSPGETYGVDIDSLFIDEAKKLAVNEGINNIRYSSGDIDNLNFDDSTFDVAYCRLTLMHVKNPVKTVTELKRVTKRGGIVAVSDTDYGGSILYPELPKMMHLYYKYGHWAEMRGVNCYIGRQLSSIFSQAGLDSIAIYPFTNHATQQNPEMLKMLLSVFVQMAKLGKESMIKRGLITEEDYAEAMKEIKTFVAYPGAFAMAVYFLAVGQVS
jgi:ubiquinone/menaquinone biosynthesis C-methylase UbiE